jgi:hypothetical protein
MPGIRAMHAQRLADLHQGACITGAAAEDSFDERQEPTVAERLTMD